MIRNTAKQTDARTVTVDPSHPLAELHMRAVMTWPTDRSKRDEAVATFAAWSLAEPGTGVAARADAVSVLRTAVEQQGYTLNDLMNDPAGRLFLRTTEQEWVERTIRFFSEAMTAAGGIGAVARAPGLDSIVQKMRDVERSEVPVVGSVLCFVTQMHLHHPDVIASQNRGWAVFERAAGGKPPCAPTKEAKFKTAWWLPLRGVAPLYAAYKIAQQVRLLVSIREHLEFAELVVIHSTSFRFAGCRRCGPTTTVVATTAESFAIRVTSPTRNGRWLLH